MRGAAFLPDIRELPHLLVQPADTFLGGRLKLRVGEN